MRKSLVETHPELLGEWDFDNNVEDPYSINWNSSKKIWWVCSKDKRHRWHTQLGCRTRLGAGCPFCSGLRVLREESFGFLCPGLLEEWGSKNQVDPFTIRCGSDRKVWWICQHGHEWKTSIKHRTVSSSNCPYCAGKKIGYGNSFGDKCPQLLSEWDYDKNTFDPFSIGLASHKSAWWKCSLGHTWKARIKDRTLRGRGCPHCSKRRSDPAKKWLDDLGIEKREHYLNVEGRKFFADGFDPKTNTVYEYFGDFWHGNPEKYDPKDIHPIAKKTFGELYKVTLDKVFCLKSAGYNVICKWGT